MGTQSTVKTTPAISVIVPAYGMETMLGDALDSLLAQDRTDWEAIVIDDGDARIAAAIKTYTTDPRIRFVQTENGGLPTARNRAIALAQAPLISLLDGDDAYLPTYVSKMIAAIERSPTIAIACCDATYFGHDRVEERFSSYCPQVLPATLARVLRREFNIFICTTFRREAILAVGGFDPNLKSVEDLDAWLRLIETGWDVAYVAEPLARYRRRPGQMSSNNLVMHQSAMTVFEHAEQRLAGRPEQAIAAEMVQSSARLLEIEKGIRKIRDGSVGDGIELLHQADVHKHSLRWRLALALMRVAPRLARPLIRMRDRV